MKAKFLQKQRNKKVVYYGICSTQRSTYDPDMAGSWHCFRCDKEREGQTKKIGVDHGVVK